jgi:hypothetical protein
VGLHRQHHSRPGNLLGTLFLCSMLVAIDSHNRSTVPMLSLWNDLYDTDFSRICLPWREQELISSRRIVYGARADHDDAFLYRHIYPADQKLD